MSVKYHEGKFPPTQLDWERLAIPLERASTAVSRYDSFLGIIPDSSIMLAPMLVQEAVASSRMEGTHATVGDVLAYEAGNEFDSAKNDDVLEVVNYRRALHKSVEMLNDLPLSGRVLKSAHKILLHNVRGSFKSPGQYRNDQNWIGRSNKIEEARYIPIPPEKLEDAMASWERFVNESSMPSLIKVSIAHAEFESIHPFRDGNGRIGRMLVPLMLNLDGLISHPCLYLSEFSSTEIPSIRTGSLRSPPMICGRIGACSSCLPSRLKQRRTIGKRIASTTSIKTPCSEPWRRSRQMEWKRLCPASSDRQCFRRTSS